MKPPVNCGFAASMRLLIYIRRAALWGSETLLAPYSAGGERDHVRVVERCPQVQCAVCSAGVVVRGVLVQDYVEVSLAEDYHAVGAFGSRGAYPAFDVGVGSRALRGDLDRFDALALEDRLEAAGELRVPVADQAANLPSALAEVDGEVPGQLNELRADRGSAVCRRSVAASTSG